MQNDMNQAEMPRYQSHKEVRALKIKEVVRDFCRTGDRTGVTVTLVPVDEGFAPFEVSAQYVAKHDPHPGGYFVVYADGYQSFSPAKAFEEGYTRISLANPDPIS